MCNKPAIVSKVLFGVLTAIQANSGSWQGARVESTQQAAMLDGSVWAPNTWRLASQMGSSLMGLSPYPVRSELSPGNSCQDGNEL